MAFANYLRLTLLVDSVKQTQVTQVRVKVDGKNQPVETLEGLVGKTPGSKRLELTGNWAVPVSGLEFDVFTAVSTGSLHEIQIPIGDKSIIAKGWFEDSELSGSVNANTEVSATFIGEVVPPQ